MLFIGSAGRSELFGTSGRAALGRVAPRIMIELLTGGERAPLP